MTESEERLRRRYRELAYEEPSAAIDAAILAAAKRASVTRSRSRRWAVPLSAAAIFVLALGVTLRMQRDQPGVETAMPPAERAANGAPSVLTDAAPSPLVPAEKERAKSPPAQSPQALLPRAQAPRAPSPSVANALPSESKSKSLSFASRPASAGPAGEGVPTAQSAPAAPAPAAAEKKSLPIEPRAPAAVPPAAEPAARPESAPLRPTPFAAAAPAPEPAANANAPLRAKGEELPADALDASLASLAPARDEELERIARLRREGRHAEADKALEEFRKKYADYRIPEAIWTRVKPR